MNLPIPDFIPVPGGEAMRMISLVLLANGVCMATAGVLFLYWSKRKGREKNPLAWILIGVGGLLAVNHGIQLIV